MIRETDAENRSDRGREKLGRGMNEEEHGGRRSLDAVFSRPSTAASRP